MKQEHIDMIKYGADDVDEQDAVGNLTADKPKDSPQVKTAPEIQSDGTLAQTPAQQKVAEANIKEPVLNPNWIADCAKALLETRSFQGKEDQVEYVYAIAYLEGVHLANVGYSDILKFLNTLIEGMLRMINEANSAKRKYRELLEEMRKDVFFGTGKFSGNLFATDMPNLEKYKNLEAELQVICGSSLYFVAGFLYEAVIANDCAILKKLRELARSAKPVHSASKLPQLRHSAVTGIINWVEARQSVDRENSEAKQA